MIQEYKDLLTLQKTDIQTAFNKFKTLRPFLGVYKRSSTNVFLTFGFSSSFVPTLRVGRNDMNLITTFNSALDFETQFQSMMSS